MDSVNLKRGKWKGIELGGAGVNFGDDAFQFISNFEEFVPSKLEDKMRKKKKSSTVAGDEQPSEPVQQTPESATKAKKLIVKKEKKLNLTVADGTASAPTTPRPAKGKKKSVAVKEQPTATESPAPPAAPVTTTTTTTEVKKRKKVKRKAAVINGSKPGTVDEVPTKQAAVEKTTSVPRGDSASGEEPKKLNRREKRKLLQVPTKQAAVEKTTKVPQTSVPSGDSASGEEPKKLNRREKRKLLQQRRAELAAKKAKRDEEKLAAEKLEEKKNEPSDEDDDSEEEDNQAATEPSPAITPVDISNWRQFDLPKPILKAIGDLGFYNPSEIQAKVLSTAVRDRLDILGAAETGSGKTLAYAIPAVCRCLEAQENAEGERTGPLVLVLAPTRELVVQVKQHINALIKYTNIKRAVSIVGGLSAQKQQRLLNTKPEIVIGTPGRLWGLMGGMDAISYLADMSCLRVLVIDETDRMVERGHFEELELILGHVKKSAAQKLQTLVFSATLTYVNPTGKKDTQAAAQLSAAEKLKRIVEMTGLRKQRKVFDITKHKGTAERLVETRINCDNLLMKDTIVAYLLNRYRGRTLIFINSVDASRRLHGILSKLKFSPEPMLLHAKMNQRQRLANLEKFTAVPNSVLLATDVAARGLDIKGIEHVIHYHVPNTAELYIHRSGRTARASSVGLTVLLVDPMSAQSYRNICKNLNREEDLPVFPIDASELYNALEPRVEVASEIDSLAHKASRVKSQENWFAKAAKACDIDLDQKKSDKEAVNEQIAEYRAKEKTLQKELKILLARPLPAADRGTLPKTRYITHTISKEYEGRRTLDAIDSFKQQVEERKELKKKSRKHLTAKDIKVRKFKNKKK